MGTYYAIKFHFRKALYIVFAYFIQIPYVDENSLDREIYLNLIVLIQQRGSSPWLTAVGIDLLTVSTRSRLLFVTLPWNFFVQPLNEFDIGKWNNMDFLFGYLVRRIVSFIMGTQMYNVVYSFKSLFGRILSFDEVVDQLILELIYFPD